MHIEKSKQIKMDLKPNFYILSKEDFSSVCLYKLKYLSCLAIVLPKF
jgi:hypothetical protein